MYDVWLCVAWCGVLLSVMWCEKWYMTTYCMWHQGVWQIRMMVGDYTTSLPVWWDTSCGSLHVWRDVRCAAFFVLTWGEKCWRVCSVCVTQREEYFSVYDVKDVWRCLHVSSANCCNLYCIWCDVMIAAVCMCVPMSVAVCTCVTYITWEVTAQTECYSQDSQEVLLGFLVLGQTSEYFCKFICFCFSVCFCLFNEVKLCAILL